MARHSRQTLATYAFFEEARKTSRHAEDALIPLVLPAIAGKRDSIFSPAQLACDLEPIFGPEFVHSLAEALVDPLVRQGYLRKESGGPEGAVYIFTEKTEEIPLEALISSAERDLEEIISTLEQYISSSHTIRAIDLSGDALTASFVDWITTVEEPLSFKDYVPGGDQKVQIGQTTAAPAQPPKAYEKTNVDHLHLVFSAFVEWLSRERKELFEKVVTFAEIGLVIDLVSEIRVPTRRKPKIDLTVVLDSAILMELLGMCGPHSHQSAMRLMELCKKHGIQVITLTHLVEEINEIAYNVLQSGSEWKAGSVNDAVRKYAGVRELVDKVHRSPEACVKNAGIKIYPYTQSNDVRSLRFFTDGNVHEFADYLPYDKQKPMMAKRDAWSLAYAIRRQNGAYASNIYEAKCVILTRSHVFASATKRYLSSDSVVYPNYAVIPVVELRHFSTLFLLAFGSDATRGVVRAELVASCEKILRVSPGITKKIREILARMNEFSEAQLDAVLSDPTTIAEFALATGNDPSVVNATNGAALVEVIRSATIKDEELRHRLHEQRIEREYQDKIEKHRQRADEAERRAQLAAESANHSEKRTEETGALLIGQKSITASVIAARVRSDVGMIWGVVTITAIILASGFVVDMFIDVTSLTSPLQAVASAVLGLVAAYATLAFFVPGIDPSAIRNRLLQKCAHRHLQSVNDDEIHKLVIKELRQPNR